MVLGGTMFRSAQFGFYEAALGTGTRRGGRVPSQGDETDET